MFGLSSLELRLAFYGVLLAAICAGLLYERYQGYEACRAPQIAAEKAQVAKDLETAKGTIHDLNQRLADITAAQPSPHVLLCRPPRSVRESTAPTGAQPLLATPPGNSPSGVPPRAAGIDIGGELQNLREASQVIAIYRDETIDWALKQGQR